MSASTTTAPPVEVSHGEWVIDRAHSSATFEVEHAGLSVFRGSFEEIDAVLASGDAGLELSGSVRIDSISIEDQSIRPHLLSPEFFDAERNPTVEFRSTGITGGADDLTVRGELSMAGTTRTVEARGRLRGPVPGPGGGEKLGLRLEATIDRTDFGMNWQMEMPGGALALGLEVRLVADLELALG
jgi:polyisoprenoid-binding protein YceI